MSWNAVGNMVHVAGTGRVFGTTGTVRHDWAISECRRQARFDAHLTRLQGHRRHADSEEQQICTTCLFAESVGLCLCFLPSCALYEDNAVGNVVAETGRDLVFMTTPRLSDLSMSLKGEVRRSPEQSAWQPIARSGKFVRRASSRRAFGSLRHDPNPVVHGPRAHQNCLGWEPSDSSQV